MQGRFSSRTTSSTIILFCSNPVIYTRIVINTSNRLVWFGLLAGAPHEANGKSSRPAQALFPFLLPSSSRARGGCGFMTEQGCLLSEKR